MHRSIFSKRISRFGQCFASSHTNKSSKARDVSAKTQTIIDRETRYGAANYHPLPVVIQRGSGQFLNENLFD